MEGVDFIVQYLKEHAHVSHFFVYAGGTNAWLLDALYRADGISFVAMRHEQNAAFAAEGYARAGERVGVVSTMSGPGATNLMTGIADAYFDSVPVIFLTGQVTSTTYKGDRSVRQLGYQETDIVSIARPITKQAVMARGENEMVVFLRNSISVAKSGRPGPILLDIPSDIQRREVDEDELRIKPVITNSPSPTEAEIEAVLDMIDKALRPIVLVGGGVRGSGACELLIEFIDRFQIPVVVSLMGKDSFPNEHPLFVGFIGSYGNRYANLSLANCDLVIALGSRLDSRQTANPKTFARAAKKIHVDIDSNELNNTVVSDLAIHSNLTGFLEMILTMSSSHKQKLYPQWVKYINEVKREFDIETVPCNDFVNPKVFLRELSSLTTGREIFLADVGNNQMWAAQELKIRHGQRFIVSGGLGTMGFAIPAGIGAHYACPDSPIVSIVGDGGFQMSIPELETIVHNRIPLKIIVFNNGVLGLMWHFQTENFEEGHPATEEGYSCPDIKRIAKAYRIPFARMENNDKIPDGLSWLLSTKGPVILEVQVHRSWPGYPKIKPGNPLEGQLPEIGKEKLKKYMLIPLLDS